MIRVFKTGPHSHRMPVSYPALAPLWEDRIALVNRPEAADLYIFAHVLDIHQAPRALVEDWRIRRRPVVLLSEEPFWDTIWTKRPLDAQIIVDSPFGALPVMQVSHQTSNLFDFDQIPYYLLTDHRFANAYGSRFARNAARSAAEWAADFAARPIALSFMFERRPGQQHDVRWPEGDVIGLCAWRTDLALASPDDSTERLGISWQGGAARRFALPDWHLDKLVALDGRARMMGALENTHQPQYLTEKFFDAFACGSLPLYFASPGHRAHTLGLPPDSWLNLYDLDPAAARDAIADWTADRAFFEAYREAQAQLSDLFTSAAPWLTERARLRKALPQILAEILDS